MAPIDPLPTRHSVVHNTFSPLTAHPVRDGDYAVHVTQHRFFDQFTVDHHNPDVRCLELSNDDARLGRRKDLMHETTNRQRSTLLGVNLHIRHRDRDAVDLLRRPYAREQQADRETDYCTGLSV